LNFSSFEAFDWWFELVGGFQKLDKVFLLFFFSAFSALFFAQVPCGVLSGGEDLVMCLIFLVLPQRIVGGAY
jgi:hypothetical protein